MMNEQRAGDLGDPSGGSAPFDTSVAHPARIWDYWLGGKDNFAADRVAARKVLEAMPTVASIARADRAFLRRAVSYLVTECGIRQFLDIGTGLPTASNTHEVAQRAAPESRIVYVDNDPMVLAHARALLTSHPAGATSYIHADLRDPGTVLDGAAQTLDFTKPVAVMLLGILLFLPDADDPYGIVARLMDAVPAGSYLAILHGANDIRPDEAAMCEERYTAYSAVPLILRTKAGILRFFDGLDIVEPGVVQPHRWRPGREYMAQRRELAAYCGVAKKPAPAQVTGQDAS